MRPIAIMITTKITRKAYFITILPSFTFILEGRLVIGPCLPLILNRSTKPYLGKVAYIFIFYSIYYAKNKVFFYYLIISRIYFSKLYSFDSSSSTLISSVSFFRSSLIIADASSSSSLSLSSI